MIACTLIPFKYHRKLEASLIFLLGLAIFTLGLFNHEFIEFESRFGLFAQEMLRNGITFFPTTYNQYYPDYPATQTILTYLFSLPFDKVSILTAVLPTAITSACTLSVVYLIGSLQSRRWGLYGVLFSLFTYYFLFSARTITLDQFITTATALCFYCCYSAQLQQNYQRLWWLPLIWLISFLFRGPIGLVIPASISIAYFAVEKNISACIRFSIAAGVLLAFCMVGLLGIAWYQGGDDLLQKVFEMQFFSRINNDTPVPFYEYFTIGLSSYAPTFLLACLVIANYGKQFFQTALEPNVKLLRHLALYFLIILIGLSIPSSKKIRYILPITPAIGLIAAYLFIDKTQSQWMKWVRRLVNYFCVALPFIGLSTLLAGKIISHKQSLVLDIHYLAATILLTGLASLICILPHKKSLSIIQKEFTRISTGVAALVVIFILIAQPLDVQFNRALPFVNHVKTLLQKNQQLAFYDFNPDGNLIKFMVAFDAPLTPKILSSTEQLQKTNTPTLFIAEKKDFDHFPTEIKKNFQVLYTGDLGHAVCVVFVKIN